MVSISHLSDPSMWLKPFFETVHFLQCQLLIIYFRQHDPPAGGAYIYHRIVLHLLVSHLRLVIVYITIKQILDLCYNVTE